MRATFSLMLVVAVSAMGCQACIEATGIEVVREEDMQPLPVAAPGPRGLPASTPLPGDTKGDLSSEVCVDSPAEREHAAYVDDERNRGSARVLRGRVAVLDLRIASAAGEPWSVVKLRHADKEATTARAFILREAGRRGVNDLTLDVVPWFVTTELPAIRLTVDGRGRPDWAEAEALRAGALRHVESATGVSVAQAVSALKKSGYGEVAVMVRLPTTQVVREFAPSSRRDGLDLAFVQLRPTEIEPGTYAHELLHLFGADDLYQLTSHDSRDDGDIMGAACTGTRTAPRIADATAWAIGWESTPPARTFAIGGARPAPPAR